MILLFSFYYPLFYFPSAIIIMLLIPRALSLIVICLYYIVSFRLNQYNINKYVKYETKQLYQGNQDIRLNMMNEINLPIKKKLPVTVLSGFLGSGKTTLLKHILTSDHNGRKYAIIVNDMNELNIDTMLIQPYIKQQEEKLIEFSNGCICCTLRDDLLKEVANLANQNKFEHLIIESTGISEPLPVAETFTFELTDEQGLTQSLSQLAEIDTMVTVVDAVNFLKDIDVAEDLSHRGLQADVNDTRSITDLLVSQVEFANVILINKCDLVSVNKLLKVKQTIRAFNADAKIIESTHAKIDINEIIGSKTYDYEKVSQSATWLHAINQQTDNEKIPETEEYGISSFIYRARKPFHPLRLMNFIENELVGDDGEDEIVPTITQNTWNPSVMITSSSSPSTSSSTSTSSSSNDNIDVAASQEGTRIIRSKGFFWLASRPSDTMVWSQAGGLFHLTSGGPWWADTPRDQWPTAPSTIKQLQQIDFTTEKEASNSNSKVIKYVDVEDDNVDKQYEDEELFQQIQSDWVEPFGDRRQELVFIGVDMNQSIVQSKLDLCLLSEDEMQRGWSDWETLEDPFPMVEEDFVATTQSSTESIEKDTTATTNADILSVTSVTTTSSIDTGIVEQEQQSRQDLERALQQKLSYQIKSLEQLMIKIARANEPAEAAINAHQHILSDRDQGKHLFDEVYPYEEIIDKMYDLTSRVERNIVGYLQDRRQEKELRRAEWQQSSNEFTLIEELVYIMPDAALIVGRNIIKQIQQLQLEQQQQKEAERQQELSDQIKSLELLMIKMANATTDGEAAMLAKEHMRLERAQQKEPSDDLKPYEQDIEEMQANDIERIIFADMQHRQQQQQSKLPWEQSSNEIKLAEKLYDILPEATKYVGKWILVRMKQIQEDQQVVHQALYQEPQQQHQEQQEHQDQQHQDQDQDQQQLQDQQSGQELERTRQQELSDQIKSLQQLMIKIARATIEAEAVIVARQHLQLERAKAKDKEPSDYEQIIDRMYFYTTSLERFIVADILRRNEEQSKSPWKQSSNEIKTVDQLIDEMPTAARRVGNIIRSVIRELQEEQLQEQQHQEQLQQEQQNQEQQEQQHQEQLQKEEQLEEEQQRQIPLNEVKSFEQLMDEMQLAVEKTFNNEESVKKLEEVITSFAKIPQIKIREIVRRYQELGVSAFADIPTLTSNDDLEAHLRGGLSVLWSASNNNWESFEKLFQLEVSKESALNTTWMKAAIVLANNGSEKKLKDLIKKYGTINEIPKGRRYSVDIENARGGQGKGRKKSILKVDYVASLIELLRENNENDYHKVFQILEKENLTSKKKEASETKGFSK